MRILAPAKINLHLRVGARRDDGFHPLVSWMCTVGLFDALEISSRTSGSIVQLKCDDPNLPTDSRNLVVRAAEALARVGNVTPVTIELKKQIPAGGGLGGGSSDAAATLVALDKFWKLNLSREQLRAIAADLGSDMPFFLFGSSSICTGRGEIVRPIAPPKPSSCVLILPPISCSTPAVYAKFDELHPDGSSLTEEPWYEWASLPAVEFLSRLSNDLQPAAYQIQPDLQSLRDKTETLLNRPVRMSGSGSTLFTLFDQDDGGDDSARNAAEQIERKLQVRAHFVRLAASSEV